MRNEHGQNHKICHHAGRPECHYCDQPYYGDDEGIGRWTEEMESTPCPSRNKIPQPSKEGDVREKIVHILIRGFATFSTEEKYRSPGADLSDITTKYTDRLLTLFQSLLKEEREKGEAKGMHRMAAEILNEYRRDKDRHTDMVIFDTMNKLGMVNTPSNKGQEYPLAHHTTQDKL